MYGRPAGEIAPELKAAVLVNDKMITERPGSLIEPGWEKAKAEAAGFARIEEDVMTYALFPEIAPAFLSEKVSVRKIFPHPRQSIGGEE